MVLTVCFKAACLFKLPKLTIIYCNFIKIHYMKYLIGKYTIPIPLITKNTIAHTLIDG
jgi:hypothetical protein